MKTKSIPMLLLALTLALAGCQTQNGDEAPDENVALTGVALTIEARIGATTDALASVTPTLTNTPEPSATPAPTEAPTATAIPDIVQTITNTPFANTAPCDDAAFIADVTVPDGTQFNPGDGFVKTWKIQNVGSCTWSTSYQIVFSSGNKMGADNDVPMPIPVPPGGIVEISITMETPSDVSGTVRGNWLIQNEAGVAFGLGGLSPFYVEIFILGGDTATPDGSATATPTPDGSATETPTPTETPTETATP